MLITGTEGYLPVQKKTARTVGAAGPARVPAQDGRYDLVTVSARAAQDGHSFRELAAALSRQVRTHNTTGKIQELRRQVRSGEYQIEPGETAARMLLLTGEGE